MGSDGVEQPLILAGRGPTEWAAQGTIRPLPPAEPAWAPAVDDNCEFAFQDGWWRVRVLSAAAGQFTVVYTPANATHTVGLETLRPVCTWDAVSKTHSRPKGRAR